MRPAAVLEVVVKAKGVEETNRKLKSIDASARKASASAQVLGNRYATVTANLKAFNTATRSSTSAMEAQDKRFIRLKDSVSGLNSALKKTKNATAASNVGEVDRGLKSVDKSAEKAARALDDVSTSSKGVDRDSNRLTRAVESISRHFRRSSADASEFNRTMLLTRNVIRLVRFPAMIVGLEAMIQALGAAGAAAVALVGALGPLSGVAAAAGVGLTAAAQGAGVFALAAMGVGAALKEQLLAHQKTIPVAARGAKQDISSAKAIASAQDGVRQAKYAVGQASRGVQDALRGEGTAARTLIRAQQDERSAQIAVTAARMDAKRTIEDMKSSLRDLVLAERGASLGLKEAQKNLRETSQDPNSTLLQRQEALLNVAEAEKRLKDSQRDRARATVDTAAAERKGVNQSDQVVQAERAAADAHQAVKDAMQGVKDAAQTTADAQHTLSESQREVVKSMQDVVDAQKQTADTATIAGASLNNLSTKFDQLPAPAKKFVRALQAMKPQFDSLRSAAAAGLFPGVTKGLKAAAGNLGVFRGVISKTAGVMGGLAQKAGELVGGKAFGKDIEKIGSRNAKIIGTLGDGALHLASAFRHVLVAAGPLTSWLARLAKQWSINLDATAKTNRENGKLAGFFQKTRAVLTTLGHSLFNVAKGLFNIFKGATPLGNNLLDLFEKLTKRFADWSASTRGKNQIAAYFRAAKDPILETVGLIGDISGALLRLSRGNTVTGLAKTLRPIVPILENVVEQTTNAFGPTVIKAVGSLLKLFAELAGSAGPLVLITGLIGTIADGITWLLKHVSGLRTFAFAVITVAAGFKALKFVLIPVTSAFRFLSVVILGEKLAAESAGIANLGLRLSLLKMAIAEKAAAGWTALLAIKQKILTRAYAPWLIAIGLAIAAFKHAYETSAKFRKVIDALASSNLARAIGALIAAFTFRKAISSVGGFAKALAGVKKALIGLVGLEKKVGEAVPTSVPSTVARGKGAPATVVGTVGKAEKTAAGAAKKGRGGLIGALAGGAGAAGGALSKKGLAAGAKSVLRGAGKFAAPLVGVDVAMNLVDSHGNPIAAAVNTAHDLTFGIVPKIKVKTGSDRTKAQLGDIGKQMDELSKRHDWEGLRRLQDRLKGMTKEATDFGRLDLAKTYKKMSDAIERNLGAPTLNGIGRTWDDFANRIIRNGRTAAEQTDITAQKIRDTLGRNTKAGKEAAVDNFRNLAREMNRQIEDGTTSVTNATRIIKKHLATDTKDGRVAAAGEFRTLAQKVKDRMGDSKEDVRKGTHRINELLAEALTTLGFDRKQAKGLVKHAQGTTGPQGLGGTGNANERATVFGRRGGHITQGKASGDSVPAMLEKGEYVLNRKAVAKTGTAKLDALNFGSAPRFQKGGGVGTGTVTGDTDFLPKLMVALQKLSAAAGTPIFVQSGRRTVAEQLALGPSTPGHPVAGANGPHVRGVAADITPGFPAFSKLAARFGLGFTVMPQEPWHIQLLDSVGGAASAAASAMAAPKIPGVESKIPGPIGAVVNRTLEITRNAAQMVADRAASSIGSAVPGPEGSVSIAPAAGSGAKLMRSISKMRGWSFADWWKVDAKETGHGANLVNPTSTARLRGQFLDSNWGKYGPGSDPRQNPTMNQQIMSMAQYIAERYGNPSNAWAHEESAGWYQRGGPVAIGGKARGIGAVIAGKTGLANAARKKPSAPKFKPGIHLKDTFKAIKTGGKKVAASAVTNLLGKIKHVELPQKMLDGIAEAGLANSSAADYANRAADLTDTDAISVALQAEFDRRSALGQAFPNEEQDALAQSMFAQVQGLTQGEWLAKQLDALRDLRNRLIKAIQWAQRKQAALAKMEAKARERLDAVTTEIGLSNTRRATLEANLATAKDMKKGPERHAKVARLTAQIAGLDERQRGRNRLQSALKDQIIPALVGQEQALGTAASDMLSGGSTNLFDVQGFVPPDIAMTILPTLPDVGVLGGTIFDVQMQLRGLLGDQASRRITSASESADTGNDQNLADLQTLLNQANLRTALSQSQFQTLRDFPNFPDAGIPYGGAFESGGVVPGMNGAPTMILAHGGETVTPVGAAPVIHLHVDPAMSWLKKFIRVEVDSGTRRQASNSRDLPGLRGVR